MPPWLHPEAVQKSIASPHFTLNFSTACPSIVPAVALNDLSRISPMLMFPSLSGFRESEARSVKRDEIVSVLP